MDKCRWCDQIHGAKCPLVKAIEYHEDGVTVKRVEFMTAADYPQTMTLSSWPFPVPYIAPGGTPTPQPGYVEPRWSGIDAGNIGFSSQH